MANTRELRRRIKSVKNTSQITKAMQMVAAAKMRKAQNQALNGRPYSSTLNEALMRLAPGIDPEVHPLLGGIRHSGQIRHSELVSESNQEMTNQVRHDKAVGVLLLSTDRGLCGALNTNLFRALSSLRMHGSNKQNDYMDSRLRGNDNVVYYSVGKKGRNFLVKTGKKLEADFENPEVVIFKEARQIARLLIQSFINGELKEVYLVFPDFISTLRQEPKVIKLLPIDSSVIPAKAGIQLKTSSSELDSPLQGNDNKEFLFEPNPDTLLDYILVHYIETQIYQGLLETKASEHSSRMMAMQNATDNAKELVEDLKLTYNQTRQSAITNELLEITTAAAALE